MPLDFTDTKEKGSFFLFSFISCRAEKRVLIKVSVRGGGSG